MVRQPNFQNLLKVLKKEVPERPTLFEFFLNNRLIWRLVGENDISENPIKNIVKAYHKAGYDYATVHGSDFHFPFGDKDSSKSSRNMNTGALIQNISDFEKYEWPEPENFDYSQLEKCSEYLPDGMKLIVYGPNGVLENVTELVGYDNMCYMLMDEPDLLQEIFNAVGSRMLRYYEICSEFDTVGALMSNDDWGFKQQTMISPNDLRKYVFPWHKKIVNAAHKVGKTIILHSCGKLDTVFDDIIYDMSYDAKHSYEDIILPVEQACVFFRGKIAVLGGIDIDYICRESRENIISRCTALVDMGMQYGGYALGTGNSIAPYVPDENYFAMLEASGIDVKKF